MRVLLFDPYATGHHNFYLSQLATDIGSRAEIVAVASDEVDISSSPAKRVGTVTRGDSRDRRKTSAVFADAVARNSPDAAIHLFADSDLPVLAARRPFKIPTTLLLFRPRAHYPSEFDSPLSAGERARGLASEAFVRLWLARSRTNRVMSLDEYAVAKWERSHGDQARWWPEPPAERTASSKRVEGQLVVFGSLAPRKGIAELLDALLKTNSARSLVLAGRVDPGFRSEIDAAVTAVERRGINVQVTDDWISDEDATQLLASASVVVVGYPRHYGMSRVMLEAAAVGTPVVGSSFGLIGKQIRDHGLGAQVDVTDATAFAAAIDEVLERGPESFVGGLDAFASRYSADARSGAIEFILQQ